MSTHDLIQDLNENLAAESGTIIRYNDQASQCFGPAGGELREVFEREVHDEISHARTLQRLLKGM